MREILSENQALLTYEVTQAGVCILRCQTADAVVQLPDTLDGQPVTALGDYVYCPALSWARVELARLGNDAGIIGAAMLGRNV